MGKYDDLSAAELEEELGKRDLATSGNKDEKRARLEESDSADGSTEGWRDTAADLELNEETNSIYAPEDLMDPDRPFSAENPVKAALVNKPDEGE